MLNTLQEVKVKQGGKLGIGSIIQVVEDGVAA